MTGDLGPEIPQFNSFLPPGTIVLYGAAEVPALPWILCDGSEISRKVYSTLFQVIGVKYGVGDGITTFNLPDFRGRVVIGVDYKEMRMKKAQDVGLSGGSVSQKLHLSQIPKHSHGKGSLNLSFAGEHQHVITDPGHDHGGETGEGPNGKGEWGLFLNGVGSDRVGHRHTIPRGTTGITMASAGNHNHYIDGETGTAGDNEEFEVIPPFQTANYIIYSG